MGAGLSSSSSKVNVNLNTGGGSKKQGITSRVGLDSWSNRQVQIHSNGIGRNLMFYTNQLGGVGRHKSMFLSPGQPKPVTFHKKLQSLPGGDAITETNFISTFYRDFIPNETTLSKREVLSKIYKYLIKHTDGKFLYKSKLHLLPVTPIVGGPVSLKCDSKCTNNPTGKNQSGGTCLCNYVAGVCVCLGWCSVNEGIYTCMPDETPPEG